MARTLQRWAAISCIHAPFQRKKPLDKLLERLEEGGPFGKLDDFIVLGDLLENSTSSIHPTEVQHTLADEFESAAEYLEEIRKRLPRKCRLHWMLGNHDDNLQVKDSRRTKASTRELIHWMDSKWQPVFAKWKQYPYIKPSRHNQSGVLRIGQCCFIHGWDAGMNSDEIECLQTVNAVGGHSHVLVVRGHTHTPKRVTQCKKSAKVPLPFYYANAGTMGPLQPDYMSRKDCSGWGPAVVWGECMADTLSRYAGVQWTAETELL